MLDLRVLITILSVYNDLRELGRLTCKNSGCLGKARLFINKIGLKQEIYRPSNLANDYSYLFVSKDKEKIQKAIDWHFGIKDSGPEASDNKLFGKLYGYPDCCIDFFKNNISSEGDDSQLLWRAYDNSLSNIFPIYTNWFSSDKLILHLPHAFDCLESKALGEKHLEIIRDYNQAVYRRVLTELERCILVKKGKVIAFSNCEFDEFGISLSGNFDKNICPVLLDNQIIWAGSKDICFWRKELVPFKKRAGYRLSYQNRAGIKILVFTKNRQDF